MKTWNKERGAFSGGAVGRILAVARTAWRMASSWNWNKDSARFERWAVGAPCAVAVLCRPCGRIAREWPVEGTAKRVRVGKMMRRVELRLRYRGVWPSNAMLAWMLKKQQELGKKFAEQREGQCQTMPGVFGDDVDNLINLTVAELGESMNGLTSEQYDDCRVKAHMLADSERIRNYKVLYDIDSGEENSSVWKKYMNLFSKDVRGECNTVELGAALIRANWAYIEEFRRRNTESSVEWGGDRRKKIAMGLLPVLCLPSGMTEKQSLEVMCEAYLRTNQYVPICINVIERIIHESDQNGLRSAPDKSPLEGLTIHGMRVAVCGPTGSTADAMMAMETTQDMGRVLVMQDEALPAGALDGMLNKFVKSESDALLGHATMCKAAEEHDKAYVAMAVTSSAMHESSSGPDTGFPSCEIGAKNGCNGMCEKCNGSKLV